MISTAETERQVGLDGNEVAVKRRRKRPALGKGWLNLLTFASFLTLWQAVVWLGGYPSFILPGPWAVLIRFGQAIQSGLLWDNMVVTLGEIVLGFGLGATGGLLLAYLLYKSRLLEAILAPYIAASQALPVIAIAPLLVLWFGYGLLPKVLICAIIVFFPITISTVVGFKSIERSLVEVADLFGASGGQKLWLVEVPLAAHNIFAGLRLGLTLSVTGAVVGEFVSPSRGLGYLLNFSSSSLDAPLRFVALFTLVALAILGYRSLAALERRLVDW